MIRLNIKPLSVNCAWQGKKYKTKAYIQYEKDMLIIMPNLNISQGKYQLTLHFGFSSSLADLDNPVKLIQDLLQKKYKINDRDIFKLVVTKELVKKGKEFIEFNLEVIK